MEKWKRERERVKGGLPTQKLRTNRAVCAVVIGDPNAGHLYIPKVVGRERERGRERVRELVDGVKG